MSEKISLKNLEKSAFRASIQDGTIEIQIGVFLLTFAIAPLLSTRLGDFWSSMLFLPVWGLVYLILRVVRKNIIKPRMGTLSYGTYRKKRLKQFNLVMLAVNLAALVLGLVTFLRFAELSGWTITALFSFNILVFFSLAAFLLEFPRLYLYGILVASGPLVGEYLYRNFSFGHHGYPAVFGALSGCLIITGLVILLRIVLNHPLPEEEQPA